MNSDVIRILNVLLGIGCPHYDSIRYIFDYIFLSLANSLPAEIEMARCVPLSMRRCSTSQFQYSDRYLLLKITGASTPGNANNTPPSELHQASSYSTSTRFPQNGSLYILQNNQR